MGIQVAASTSRFSDSGHEGRAERIAISEARPARIVLVDDHTILREGVSALIALQSDLKVVGQAGTLAGGLSAAEELKPDLIISDISLPNRTEVQGIIEFRQRCPQSRLLILTVHDSEEYIRASLSAGADGYVLKDASRDELIYGIRSVLEGQRYLCPRAAARVVRSYLGEAPPAPPQINGVTGREREILAMIAEGMSNKLIAIAMNRSVKTIEKHRANLMRKLQLHNVAEVTRFAMHSGLFQPKGTATDEPRSGRR